MANLITLTDLVLELLDVIATPPQPVSFYCPCCGGLKRDCHVVTAIISDGRAINMCADCTAVINNYSNLC